MTEVASWMRRGQRWRQVAEDAAAALDHQACALGIRFEPGHDFERFKALRATMDQAPLNPRYDPAYCRLDHRNAAYLIGWDPEGEIASMSAVRAYDWHDGRTLASESRNLRAVYDRPELDGRHLEHSMVTAPIADRIHGRVTYNGAVVIRKDYRGARDEIGKARLSQIVSGLGRMLALGLFGADWAVAASKTFMVLNGAAKRYGWAKIEAGVTEKLAIGVGLPDCHLMWSRREDMVTEAQRIIAAGGVTRDEEDRDAAIPVS